MFRERVLKIGSIDCRQSRLNRSASERDALQALRAHAPFTNYLQLHKTGRTSFSLIT